MHNTNLMLHKTIVYGISGLLFIPIFATLLYSFSSSWGATILPDGFSLKWYLYYYHQVSKFIFR